jgi:membrane protease YdiL (CAAX protease family)
MTISATTHAAVTGTAADSAARPVAPAPHTLVLLVTLIGLSAVGAVRSPISEWPDTLATTRSRLLFYAQTVALQWIWVAYVGWGVWRSRTSIRSLIGSSRLTLRRWSRYLAIGVGAWIFWLAFSAALGVVLHPSPEELTGVMAMLPKTPPEIGAWVVFAFTAGIAEEFVYRGYLLKQFHAWTGSLLLAVGLQALVYAMAHFVLPIEMVISVGLMGLLLGGIAVWQKSLVPGMVMHVAVGLVALLSAAA